MVELTDAPERTDAQANNAHSIITSFTPSIMGEAMLRDIFVARQPLLDRLVRNIREATTSEARRHALLVGPRGIGKTHLVSMVYYAVQDDVDLRNNLRIAWLREEEWSIFSYADLLVQIFRALANEYAEDRRRLTEIADHLRRLPIDEGAIVGEAQLLEFLDDSLLLIIAENANDIFAGMGEQGQQSLRAFLQNHSRALLLTTAPALSANLSEHDAPFYGFFNTTHLQELTRAEARELLIHIAELDGPNTDLVDYLKTDEADRRLRVIETLAGGHPRIWILFSACMSQKLLDELVPLFIKMLDDLTPYYQERMRSLAPQERRLVAYLCEQRGAVPVKEIADACRLKPNAAAALLGKLEEKVFVRKAAEPTAPSIGDRRVTFYEIREPLMRLCMEVKESRAQPLGLIVEFLRLWFQEDEIKKWLNQMSTDSELMAQYLAAALARQNAVQAGAPKRIFEAVNQFNAGHTVEALNMLSAAVELNPHDFQAWFVQGDQLCRSGHFVEAISSFRRALKLRPENEGSFLGLTFALLNCGQFDDAAYEVDAALNAPPIRRALVLTATIQLCRALLSLELSERRSELAQMLAGMFATKDASSLLANGLIYASSALFAVNISDKSADEWLVTWETASHGHPEMDVAMRVLRAAVEWKRTRDRGAILRLAAEERVVLEELLPEEPHMEASPV